jgi:4'-phosphopantetheinyl transferase
MSQQLFQSMSIEDCYLKPTRIDIWEFSLVNLPVQATNLLSKEELVRANRFHFPRHHRRFIVARAMMRTILAKYLNEKPNLLNFSYNQHGKPLLNDANRIEFNLSHSKDLALLAIGQHFPLGVDLEFFSERPYDGIGKTLFSAAEINELSGQPAFLKPLVFFHIWAQKEAFIKTCGLGLAYPTEHFTVPPLGSEDDDIFDSLHDNHLKIRKFMPKIACSAALCYNPEITIFRKITVNPEDIL